MRRFYKTVITVTVLSEGAPVPDGAGLQDIDREITDGEWSGEVENDGGVELTAKQAAEALMAQGSDPLLFRLDDEGNTLNDLCPPGLPGSEDEELDDGFQEFDPAADEAEASEDENE